MSLKSPDRDHFVAECDFCGETEEFTALGFKAANVHLKTDLGWRYLPPEENGKFPLKCAACMQAGRRPSETQQSFETTSVSLHVRALQDCKGQKKDGKRPNIIYITIGRDRIEDTAQWSMLQEWLLTHIIPSLDEAAGVNPEFMLAVGRK